MTLVAHAPLQSHLGVTLYDTEGVVLSNNTMTHPDGFVEQYINVDKYDNFESSNISEEKGKHIIVSNLLLSGQHISAIDFSDTFVLTDYSITSITLSSFPSGSNVTKGTYNANNPVFKAETNGNYYILLYNNTWYAIQSPSNISTENTGEKVFGITGFSMTSLGLETINAFDTKYPQGDNFIFDFDIHRIKGIKGIKLNTTDYLSLTLSNVTHFSFWGIADKSSTSWKLYTVDVSSGMYENNTNSGNSDFSMSYSGDVLTLTSNIRSFITDLRIYSDDSLDMNQLYLLVNKHPKTPTFGFFQTAHSQKIGIAGNQLDDTMSVFNYGPESQEQQLADLHIGSLVATNIDITGSLSGNSINTASLTVANKDIISEISRLDGDIATKAASSGNATQQWVSAGYQPKGSYAAATHNHDGRYAWASHTHAYASDDHNHDGTYASASHNHDGTYLTGLSGGLSFYYSVGSAYSGYTTGTPTLGDVAGAARDAYLGTFGGSPWRTETDDQVRDFFIDPLLRLVKSDDRLKLNEAHIDKATHSLLRLRPQIYDKKRSIENTTHTMKESGLIAQEIWYDCPELRHLIKVGEGGSPADMVETSSDPSVDPDYSSWGPEPAGVNYTGLIPYLIRGFQEQHAEIQALKSEISSLRNMSGGGNVDF